MFGGQRTAAVSRCARGTVCAPNQLASHTLVACELAARLVFCSWSKAEQALCSPTTIPPEDTTHLQPSGELPVHARSHLFQQHTTTPFKSHFNALLHPPTLPPAALTPPLAPPPQDRKSTRLNSSHQCASRQPSSPGKKTKHINHYPTHTYHTENN